MHKSPEKAGTEDRVLGKVESSIRSVKLGWLAVLLAAMVMTFAPQGITAQAKELHLPYVTIDHPQFVPASQAIFLSSSNLLIGVTDGKTAKAYPAAILAQHGVVQDRMADGPIAVTW
ncbi:MAG: DUF3179 domain-containing protein [Acidobacteria bacterium]|nr:MAG: DUF3179 domain-containing protein [Acidobacteriota bacterium]